MKHFLKQTIYLLPIFLMGVSFLSVIIPYLGFNFDYVVWGNIGGFSLITDVLFFYIFYHGKYCVLTKILPIGLFIINILNIVGVFCPKYYEAWYETIIFSLILSSVIIYELNKRINK